MKSVKLMRYTVIYKLEGGAMSQNPDIQRALEVKRRHEQFLMQRTNVVGVGIGFQTKLGRPTDVVALIVNVTEKKPRAELAPGDVIPGILDGVPVDVQEVGIIKAL